MPSMPYENQLSHPAVSEEQSEGLDLLGFLRRRKAFIFLFGILGVGIGYMMFQRQIPQYQSNAWVQVIHRNSDPRLKSMLAEKDLTDSDYVIKSEKIIEPAIKNHGLAELATLKGLSQEDAVSQIAAMISTRSLSSNVVQISCTGAVPGDIRSISNAVAEEYVALQKENYTDASSDLEQLLVTARDDWVYGPDQKTVEKTSHHLVEVYESETDPLIGMGLLEGYELNIQGVAGGLVTIKDLPNIH